MSATTGTTDDHAFTDAVLTAAAGATLEGIADAARLRAKAADTQVATIAAFTALLDRANEWVTTEPEQVTMLLTALQSFYRLAQEDPRLAGERLRNVIANAQKRPHRKLLPEERARYEKTCLYCEKPFIAKRFDAQYCSDSCKMTASYTRRGMRTTSRQPIPRDVLERLGVVEATEPAVADERAAAVAVR